MRPKMRACIFFRKDSKLGTAVGDPKSIVECSFIHTFSASFFIHISDLKHEFTVNDRSDRMVCKGLCKISIQML